MNTIKFFYRFLHPVRKLYWFLFRPKTYGVKCLIEHDGQFLMIRNTYGHKKWTFPGGGIEAGESLEAAARREVAEETGVHVPVLRYLGSFLHVHEYKDDTVHCFYGVAANNAIAIDPVEIREARWFRADAFPPGISAVARKVIALYHEFLRGLT